MFNKITQVYWFWFINSTKKLYKAEVVSNNKIKSYPNMYWIDTLQKRQCHWLIAMSTTRFAVAKLNILLKRNKRETIVKTHLVVLRWE